MRYYDIALGFFIVGAILAVIGALIGMIGASR